MTKPQRVSLYRPHRRVQEHGAIINIHTGQVTIPPSMTKQEFVRECDVNNVIKQYKTHGMLSHVNAKAVQGAYTDLPDSVDFQESLHTIMVAEQAFMTLPAKVRDRFGQDPAEFLAFLSNPENVDEARKLGLANPAPQPPPAPPSPTPEPEPKKP